MRKFGWNHGEFIVPKLQENCDFGAFLFVCTLIIAHFFGFVKREFRAELHAIYLSDENF